MCDADGCDFNSYRMGDTSFYGAGLTVDTSKPFTVVTQFISTDGTATGDLKEIKRFYVQGGTTIENSDSSVSGVTGNSITDDFCAAQKTAFGDTNEFATKGGLKQTGDAIKKGMVSSCPSGMTIPPTCSGSMLLTHLPRTPAPQVSPEEPVELTRVFRLMSRPTQQAPLSHTPTLNGVLSARLSRHQPLPEVSRTAKTLNCSASNPSSLSACKELLCEHKIMNSTDF